MAKNHFFPRHVFYSERKFRLLAAWLFLDFLVHLDFPHHLLGQLHLHVLGTPFGLGLWGSGKVLSPHPLFPVHSEGCHGADQLDTILDELSSDDIHHLLGVTLGDSPCFSRSILVEQFVSG